MSSVLLRFSSHICVEIWNSNACVICCYPKHNVLPGVCLTPDSNSDAFSHFHFEIVVVDSIEQRANFFFFSFWCLRIVRSVFMFFFFSLCQTFLVLIWSRVCFSFTSFLYSISWFPDLVEPRGCTVRGAWATGAGGGLLLRFPPFPCVMEKLGNTEEKQGSNWKFSIPKSPKELLCSSTLWLLYKNRFIWKETLYTVMTYTHTNNVPFLAKTKKETQHVCLVHHAVC